MKDTPIRSSSENTTGFVGIRQYSCGTPFFWGENLPSSAEDLLVRWLRRCFGEILGEKVEEAVDSRAPRGSMVLGSKLPIVLYTLDIQIPPEKVFRVCFWGPNTFSGGVWMSRDIIRQRFSGMVHYKEDKLELNIRKCCQHESNCLRKTEDLSYMEIFSMIYITCGLTY